MTRHGALRRSAVAGLALVAASFTVNVGASAHAAPPEPFGPQRAQARGANGSDIVPDRYIVVLKKGAAPQGVRATATALTKKHGGTVHRVFTSALSGYSATMNRQQVSRAAADPGVAYVSPVRRYAGSDTQANPPSWGLDRIDQLGPKTNGSYTYPNAAPDVTAYVIDSGIDIGHADFGGRATNGYDFVENDGVAQDCAGHGTHVAGTIGGTSFGVAKSVKLVAVRVLDCEGFGTTDQVVAGIDWVTANAVKPAVANMSLGIDADDPAVNDAVSRSIASGVSFAVAAGNEMINACGASPAKVPAAITVGATDRIDLRAWFSNFGSCVDVFAPGVNIVSAAAGTGSGSVAYSGTSMAAPHVAGAVAQLLQTHPTWTPAEVRNALVTTSPAGPVHDALGAPNRFLSVATLAKTRGSFGFQAKSNNRMVLAGSAGTKPLVASSSFINGSYEKFDIVDAGSGRVALRAKANGKYVRAMSAGAKPLLATGNAIDSWGRFQLIDNVDGTVSLKALTNNKFVTAASTTAPLIANATGIGTQQKFNLQAPPPLVSIKSKASNKFVSVRNSGNPLIPGPTGIGTTEKFQVITLSSSTFALRALTNNKYVTGGSTGAAALKASATSGGTAERYLVVDYNTDGTVYLGSWVDGQAVTAGGLGLSQLASSKNIDWNSPTLGLGNGEKFFVAQS